MDRRMHRRLHARRLSLISLLAGVLTAGAAPVLAQTAAGGCDGGPTIIPDKKTYGRTVISDDNSLDVTFVTTGGTRLKRVTVYANTIAVLNLDEQQIPPPDQYGVVQMSWPYVVGAREKGKITLNPGRNILRIQAWDTNSPSRCREYGAMGVDALSAETHAVLVGINDYAATTKSLKFAKQDAERVAEHLMTHGGVRRRNITLLTDKWEGPGPDPFEGQRQEPTYEGIRVALSEVAARVDKRGMVIFYFSGHGYAPPKDNARFSESHYLLTQKATLEFDTLMLPFSDIGRKLKKVKAQRKMVILDACFSSQVIVAQSTDQTLRAKTFGAAASNEGLREFLTYNGELEATLMSSSSGTQLSYEFDGIGSIFTFKLLAAADPPMTQDATLGEAYEYAYTQLKDKEPRLKGEQVPNKWYAGNLDKLLIWRRYRVSGQSAP
jgi:hypothetical protein